MTASTINLYQHELGTLFTFERSTKWCRDGQAEIVEFCGNRYLVDTYWRDFDGPLTEDEEKTAVVMFVPSEHRRIGPGDAEVYGDEKVVRISRQNGSYVTHYVRADEPELTELDHYRHLLRAEEQRLLKAREDVTRYEVGIRHFQEQIVKLEAAQ